MIINLKKSVFEDEIKNKKVLSSVVNIHDYHNNKKKTLVCGAMRVSKKADV